MAINVYYQRRRGNTYGQPIAEQSYCVLPITTFLPGKEKSLRHRPSVP